MHLQPLLVQTICLYCDHSSFKPFESVKSFLIPCYYRACAWLLFSKPCGLSYYFKYNIYDPALVVQLGEVLQTIAY